MAWILRVVAYKVGGLVNRRVYLGIRDILHSLGSSVGTVKEALIRNFAFFALRGGLRLVGADAYGLVGLNAPAK